MVEIRLVENAVGSLFEKNITIEINTLQNKGFEVQIDYKPVVIRDSTIKYTALIVASK